VPVTHTAPPPVCQALVLQRLGNSLHHLEVGVRRVAIRSSPRIKRTATSHLSVSLPHAARLREREDREPAGPSALAALHGRSGKPFWSSTSVGTQVSPIARVYNQAKLACRAADCHGKIWGVGLMGVLNEQ
jgi:hypothetical protein